MRVTGPHPAGLYCWPDAGAVPCVAQCRAQGVAVALALVQDVGKLGLHHQQAFVLNGGHFVLAVFVAIVNHQRQPFAGGQAAPVHLGHQVFVQRFQGVVDAINQLLGRALAPATGAAHMHHEQARMIPIVTNGHEWATTYRRAQIGQHRRSNGERVGLGVIAAGLRHIAHQAIEASGVRARCIAVCVHKCIIKLAVPARRTCGSRY